MKNFKYLGSLVTNQNSIHKKIKCRLMVKQEIHVVIVQTLLSSQLSQRNCKSKYINNIAGCKTWSLTLREERRLRVFEIRILRRIFGPKRDENGEWRRLHNVRYLVSNEVNENKRSSLRSNTSHTSEKAQVITLTCKQYSTAVTKEQSRGLLNTYVFHISSRLNKAVSQINNNNKSKDYGTRRFNAAFTSALQ